MFAATNLQHKVINLSVNIVKNRKEISTFGDIIALVLKGSANNENENRENGNTLAQKVHARMGNELVCCFRKCGQIKMQLFHNID
jgi:hypothetical protein